MRHLYGENLVAFALALNDWQQKAEWLALEIDRAAESEGSVLELDLETRSGRMEDVGTGKVFTLSRRAMSAIDAQEEVLIRLASLAEQERAAVYNSHAELLVYLVAADLV